MSLRTDYQPQLPTGLAEDWDWLLEWKRLASGSKRDSNLAPLPKNPPPPRVLSPFMRIPRVDNSAKMPA